ncbi:hypothetical protein GCM10025862_38860 [Arsenicicoccus piscis]|uniref:Secreted protein n=1 Tax=Arsenicicoccus piscis TaxID=673954 RepID=A0ABQ6HTL5_9MICO|nr:hypothetical protein GCM10025862_38860 [Arsenicicoccus piscis]
MPGTVELVVRLVGVLVVVVVAVGVVVTVVDGVGVLGDGDTASVVLPQALSASVVPAVSASTMPARAGRLRSAPALVLLRAARLVGRTVGRDMLGSPWWTDLSLS